MLSRSGVTGQWDYVLIGDGSGSSFDREAGWASVLIERITLQRFVWTGFMNRGTVNIAEMMAYLQPLEWLADQAERERAGGGKTRAYQVHILTDSQYCEGRGGGRFAQGQKNAGFWGVFDVFARLGFVLNWHWIPRGDNALHEYCDALSKACRKRGKALDKNDAPLTGRVYEICPAGG